MAQRRGWFAANSGRLLRAGLMVLAVFLGGACLFAGWFYWMMANPPPVSHRAALADLDNDGDLDAVLANGINEGRSENTLWINQGGAQGGILGTFSASEQRLGSGEYHTVAAGDLDGDGDQDILAGNVWNSLDLFVNQGGAQEGQAGQFGAARNFYGAEYWGGTHPIGLGDVDGDGDLDIVSANCCGGLMMNDGGEPTPLPASNALWINQTAGAGVSTVTSWPLFDKPLIQQDTMDGTEALALGDLDGDDDLDIFMAKTTETHGPGGNEYHRQTAYRAWWNNGAGGFTPGEMTINCPNVRDLALGDLDGDGDLDALAATVIGAQVIRNQGGAQGGQAGQFTIDPVSYGGTLLEAVFLGDIDGDSSPDMLQVGQTAGQIWLNDGSGVFHARVNPLTFPSRSAAALGDVDGDGDLDVFAAHMASRQRVWRNDGTGRMLLVLW